MRTGKFIKKFMAFGVVSIIIALPIYAPSQHAKPAATKESFEKESKASGIQTDAYELSMEKSPTFKKGERCQIKVTLTNNTKEEIFYEWGFDIDEFRIRIEDRKGNIVPLSRNAPGDAVPKSGSHYLVRLAAKEKHDFDLDLCYLYNLDPGKYKLSINRPVLGKDKVTVFTAKLKPTKISVTR